MTKAELMTVRRLWIEIVQQEEYLIGLRGLLSSMERSLKAGRATVTGKKVEAMVIKVMNAEEYLQWLYERYDAAKEKLRASIREEVTDKTLRKILILRYVERLSWTEISKALDKSRREIYRIHKKFASQLDAH